MSLTHVEHYITRRQCVAVVIVTAGRLCAAIAAMGRSDFLFRSSCIILTYEKPEPFLYVDVRSSVTTDNDVFVRSTTDNPPSAVDASASPTTASVVVVSDSDDCVDHAIEIQSSDTSPTSGLSPSADRFVSSVVQACPLYADRHMHVTAYVNTDHSVKFHRQNLDDCPFDARQHAWLRNNLDLSYVNETLLC